MSYIPNTEYITIKADGVFVGGKPATVYHGENISPVGLIKENFNAIQEQNPEVQELQVGAFKTEGKYAKSGIPSRTFGPNAWCRVKLSNGRFGPWVFVASYDFSIDCARFCANNCAYNVRYFSVMRSELLKFAKTKNHVPESDLEQILGKVDLSKFVGKKVELNGYVVTVQKQR